MNAYIKIIKSATPRYLGGLIIYFVLATVAGRYLEIIYRYLRFHINNPSYILNQLWAPPFAEPYGFGAIAVILLVVPILNRHKLGLVATYVLNVVVTGITEYICAIVLIVAFGRNTFWNYSSQPFNLQGQVCLETSLLFGVIATLFVYFVYPACERLLARLTRRQFGVAVLVLSGLFAISLVLFKRW